MSRSTFVARTIVTSVALTALGVAAASPASAHTNNLYTVVSESDGGGHGFATMNKSTGIAAVLPLSVDLDVKILGIEVAGEKGVVLADTGDDYTVAEWNHNTGLAGTPIVADLADPDLGLFNVQGLDTLADGTTITTIGYQAEEGDPEDPDLVDHYAVASVDVGTGVITPLVDITDALDTEDAFYQTYSLATDPADNTTYVFVFTMSPSAYYLPVYVPGDQPGTVTAFEGDGFEAGYIGGADFDPADGSLYFIYGAYTGDGVDLELSKIGAPTTWVDATRQVISSAPANDDEYALFDQALTAESPALAATGSDLPVAAIVLVGSLAVLAGGVTVMVARRRSERGTV